MIIVYAIEEFEGINNIVGYCDTEEQAKEYIDTLTKKFSECNFTDDDLIDLEIEISKRVLKTEDLDEIEKIRTENNNIDVEICDEAISTLTKIQRMKLYYGDDVILSYQEIKALDLDI